MYRGHEFRETLRQRRPIYGLLHGLASPVAAELAGLAGYDVVIIDGEHGAGGRAMHLAVAQAAAAGGAGCFVRVSSQDARCIGEALDLGADGVLVPGIHTAEQAAAVVRATRYPPEGTRGYGLSIARASGYGLQTARYREQVKDGVFLAAIIESRQGVEEAPAIAATPGIDAIVLGMQDLSHDLGVNGDPSHPALQAALTRVEAACRDAGKAMGSALSPGNGVKEALARGHLFITMGIDTRLLGQAMTQQLADCPGRMPR